MFAHAQKKRSHAANNQNRKGPLHFWGVIAEPKEHKRDDSCRRNRGKREPRNLPFVGKPASSFWFAAHYSCNPQLRYVVASTRIGSVSPIRNWQCLKAILLQTTVESASAQAQRLCGLARVTVISGQRFFDQKCLDLFETHLLNVPRFGATSR